MFLIELNVIFKLVIESVHINYVFISKNYIKVIKLNLKRYKGINYRMCDAGLETSGIRVLHRVFLVILLF